MSQQNAGKSASGKSDAARRLLWILSLGILLAGLASYLRDLTLQEFTAQRIPLPIAPLVVSSASAASDRLPALPGSMRGQNLLVITLDTTRPDRLGCYGNHEIDTPHLDRLCARGVVFSGAVATAPATLSSHASIFTGLYPLRHGARANARYRLGSEQRTLAEELSDSGYETAAFVSSFVLDSKFGLAQGFDRYDDEVSPAAGPMGFAERRGDLTTQRAIHWLEGPHRRPFFLWVHYYDAHAPYDPPAPFAGRYAQPYDGEIAFVDEQIGRLLTAVEGARERETLVVVVADHGEGMGEHGEWSHSFLVQEATLRIPLILFARSGLPAGLQVAARVSQVDLMPTILSLLGISLPPDLDGVDLTGSPDLDRPVRAEAAEGRAYHGWARLAALYRGPLKYVEGPHPELYDLRSDPLERNDLFDSRAQDAAAMRRQLRALDGAAADALAAPAELLESGDVERLAALGYVVTGGGAVDAEEQGPDPKEMLPLMVRLQSLVSDLVRYQGLPAWKRFLVAVTRSSSARSRPELIRELEKVAADHPDFAPVYQFLAVFYRLEQRPEDAARVLERQALLRGIASPPHEQPAIR
jgi:arylsulfatase A-like enzyme